MNAPICLFVYNRPQATARLLDSLAANKEASESILYVFSDGAKNESDKGGVDEVREIFDHETRFKQVIKHYSQINNGLAKSIIDGVSYVLSLHTNVIVLEDDLLFSSDFLSFMNHALEAYQSRNDIWSISGYTPKISVPPIYHHTVFLVPRAQSWGWATWKDRWNKVDWSASKFSILRDRKQRIAFNRGGDDLYRTLDMQQHGRIESWAIRFVFAGFLNNAYTVNPLYSKVSSQGVKSTSQHGGWNDHRHKVSLSSKPIFIDPYIQPDERMILSFKRHHDLTLISKIGYFMRRYKLGYHFIKKMIQR